MATQLMLEPGQSAEELRGFARTVAEIEWLLLILVLLYQVVQGPGDEPSTAVYMALFFFAAFVTGFHYANFYRGETRWKLAIETWVMILFITWVLVYTGRLDSPLVNLYLLVIITSALSLGKPITLLEMGLIAACFMFLGYPKYGDTLFTLSYAGTLGAQLAPMLLVAYVTTMLSADIRSALSRIKLLSETDELTGIYNMRAFTAIAERTLQQSMRYAHVFSILMIDSDSLKDVNDAHGHEAGNRLLRLTVRSVQDQLRQTDVMARYGGDEFVALLSETSCKDALEVAERIRKSVESRPLGTRDRSIPNTVSIGIACFPDHGNDLETIIERADRAMYVSKNQGKNRVTLFRENQ